MGLRREGSTPSSLTNRRVGSILAIKTVDTILKQFNKTMKELEAHGAKMLEAAAIHTNTAQEHTRLAGQANAEASRAADVHAKLKDLVGL